MRKNNLLLKEFFPKTAMTIKDNTPLNARFPVIDSHNHFGKWKWNGAIHDIDPNGEWTIQDVPATIALMDEMNVKYAVNLDGGWGDLLLKNIDRYNRLFPDRFGVYAWVDWSKVGESNFGEKWAKELAHSVAAGAQGLKVFKSLGLEYRDPSGKLVMPDDSRLDPIWAMAGELKIPVLIHSADPVAFFWPLDQYNERWDELIEHPDWVFHGKDYPSFLELIESQLRVIEKHPNTTFISAHVLSYSENLGYVANALDKYPNLYVDFSARIGELGRQPYTSRKFFINYQDRILFGTDSFQLKKSIYQTYFRFLETEDEYFDYGGNQGRFMIYGISLPDSVLKKIYSDNAIRLIPGIRHD